MLSTSKASAPAAKNGDMKNSTSSSPAPAPSSSSSSPSPPAAAPKSNTGGSSAAGCSTPLQWLQNSGNYKKFLQLIDATPASARLADILDSPDVALTLLAPTDDAISDSLSKQGLSFSDLVVRREDDFSIFFAKFFWRKKNKGKKKNSLTSTLFFFFFFFLKTNEKNI